MVRYFFLINRIEYDKTSNQCEEAKKEQIKQE